MARPVKFFLGVTLCCLALLALALVFTSKPAPPPPLPNPNGYDDLVKAARLVADATGDWAILKPADLQAVVNTNGPALKLARTGLSRECQVPLDITGTNSAWLNDLGSLKRLAQAFSAEGRLAELEQRTNNAVDSYLDAIRLGHHIARGGLLIHALVGIAVESFGVNRLRLLDRTLDAQECRRVAAEVERLDSKLESSATLMAHERQWVRRTYGIKGQLEALLQYRTLRASQQRVETKLQAHQLRTEQLMLTLAARAYELDKGTQPKAIADLVPTYLKTIPQDPATGTNLAYWP